VTAPALSTVQGHDRQVAEIAIKGSLAESIQVMMLLCALLALAGAASGTLLPRWSPERHGSNPPIKSRAGKMRKCPSAKRTMPMKFYSANQVPPGAKAPSFASSCASQTA